LTSLFGRIGVASCEKTEDFESASGAKKTSEKSPTRPEKKAKQRKREGKREGKKQGKTRQNEAKISNRKSFKSPDKTTTKFRSNTNNTNTKE